MEDIPPLIEGWSDGDLTDVQFAFILEKLPNFCFCGNDQVLSVGFCLAIAFWIVGSCGCTEVVEVAVVVVDG
jgi:hypothetical protein